MLSEKEFDLADLLLFLFTLHPNKAEIVVSQLATYIPEGRKYLYYVRLF